MDVAQNYLNQCGIDLTQVTIDPTFSEVNGTQAVRITINYNYRSDLSHFIPGINSTLGLRSQVMMRRET